MHDFPYYLHVIIAFFRDGLHEGFAHVNAVLGIVIAIVATYMMHSWRQIWTITLGATIVHLISEVMLPILANNAPFRLPPNLLDWSYWRTAIALYLGYFVVIVVFYFVKSRVLPKGGHGGGH